jgi:hypothetical protein
VTLPLESGAYPSCPLCDEYIAADGTGHRYYCRVTRPVFRAPARTDEVTRYGERCAGPEGGV